MKNLVRSIDWFVFVFKTTKSGTELLSSIYLNGVYHPGRSGSMKYTKTGYPIDKSGWWIINWKNSWCSESSRMILNDYLVSFFSLERKFIARARDFQMNLVRDKTLDERNHTNSRCLNTWDIDALVDNINCIISSNSVSRQMTTWRVVGWGIKGGRNINRPRERWDNNFLYVFIWYIYIGSLGRKSNWKLKFE